MLHKMLVKFISILLVFGVLAESNSFDGRIINGQDAAAVLPYHAQLAVATGNGPDHAGSGVIITPRLIITAASNIYGFDKFRAGFGSLERTRLIWATAILANTIAAFDPLTYANNIGFIIFEENAFLAGFVPISIPPVDLQLNYPLVNEQGRISGFGWTTASGNFPDILQVAFNRVIAGPECYEVYGVDTDSNFCAKDPVSSSKICAGDQGAGFVTNINGQDYLTGIASYMFDYQCVPFVPALFVRTLSFRNYIDNMVSFWR